MYKEKGLHFLNLIFVKFNNEEEKQENFQNTSQEFKNQQNKTV